MNQSPHSSRPTLHRLSAEQARARARQMAEKRKQKRQRRILLLLLLIAAVVSIIAFARATSDRQEEAAATSSFTESVLDAVLPVTDEIETQEVTQAQTEPPETLPTLAMPSGVMSNAALLIHRESGQVLLERNADAILPPASITKVLTVITAIEMLNGDLNRTYTITQDIVDYLNAEGASDAGFVAGETVTAIDMMYAAMLPSGADGTIGLARMLCGSEDAFAVKMNELARRIGMKDSHFVNSSGLTASGHYSTCRDLAVLLDYAMDNPLFVEIMKTKTYTTAPTAQHKQGIKLTSSVHNGFTTENIERSYIIGGKTGFTNAAKLCLASAAEYEGAEYILITLAAGNGSSRPKYHFHDAVKIFDAYFDLLA